MTKYRGYPANGNRRGWATDGCGCYNGDGKCYCAECYHYGDDHVNCADAGAYRYDDKLKPVKWDGSKWVLDND